MDKELDLAALRAVRAVHREGSFTAAALALRVPKSTLSKRIADLEGQLGTRLIERTTRQLRLTQDGELLIPRLDRLLAEVDDLRRAFGEPAGHPRGHLRIAVPQVIGNAVMGRLAARFRRDHPEVTLEIHFLDRAPDLMQEGFDGALRFGPLEDSGVVARLVLEERGILAASPDLPGIATLRHPRDLAAMPLVKVASSWSGVWPLRRGEEAFDLTPPPGLALGSLQALRDAVIAGAGVGLMPHLLARPARATGQLVQVLPEWEAPRRGLYFVYPSAQSVTARLRAFIDHLTRTMRAAARG